MSNIEKIQVTYDDFGDMVDELVLRLQDKKYTAVHGLPRGGLSIAVHLSHFLKLPLITSISQYISEFNKNDDRLLVVDDIIDSGRTFERFLEIATLKNIKFDTAVLYYKPLATYTPNIYVRQTEDWIVFPWEPWEEETNREGYEHLNENAEETMSYDIESDYEGVLEEQDDEENNLDALLDD